MGFFASCSYSSWPIFIIYENLPQCRFYSLISFCWVFNGGHKINDRQCTISFFPEKKFIFAHTFVLITRRFLCLSDFISLSPPFGSGTQDVWPNNCLGNDTIFLLFSFGVLVCKEIKIYCIMTSLVFRTNTTQLTVCSLIKFWDVYSSHVYFPWDWDLWRCIQLFWEGVWWFFCKCVNAISRASYKLSLAHLDIKNQ